MAPFILSGETIFTQLYGLNSRDPLTTILCSSIVKFKTFLNWRGYGVAKVAFLLADGFEDSEMKNPYEAVKEAGHEAVIIGLEKGAQCDGKKGTVSYKAELGAAEAKSEDFDAVIIPGGSAPEKLRVNDDVVRFVKEMNEQGKLIAGICHGPQVMISADVLKRESGNLLHRHSG